MPPPLKIREFVQQAEPVSEPSPVVGLKNPVVRL